MLLLRARVQRRGVSLLRLRERPPGLQLLQQRGALALAPQDDRRPRWLLGRWGRWLLLLVPRGLLLLRWLLRLLRLLLPGGLLLLLHGLLLLLRWWLWCQWWFGCQWAKARGPALRGRSHPLLLLMMQRGRRLQLPLLLKQARNARKASASDPSVNAAHTKAARTPNPQAAASEAQRAATKPHPAGHSPHACAQACP